MRLWPQLTLALACILVPAVAGPELGRVPRAHSEAAAAAIEDWIELLGSDDFLQREEATRQIRQLQADAFDALTTATDSPQTEIRARAQLLRGELLIRSGLPGDPSSLQELLNGYAELSAEERAERIGRMSDMESWAALQVLCRIARLDASEAISKRAAASALELSLTLERNSTQPLERTDCLQLLGNSQRTATQWLRLWFQAAASDPAQWMAILRSERQQLVMGDDQVNPDVIEQLTLWLLRLLLDTGRQAEVVPFIAETYGPSAGSVNLLQEVTELLLEQQAWQPLDELYQLYQSDFDAQYVLAYRYAEGVLRQDRTEAAEQLAEAAFESLENQTMQRLEAGRDLEGRGLFAWAERELRSFIEQMGIENRYAIWATYLLAEMLHDQGDHWKSAEALQRVADAMQGNEELSQTVDQLGMLSSQSLLSRMHYFYAEHYRRQADPTQQLKHLELGTAQDPTDADLLIARYRFSEASEEFHRETLNLIRRAAEAFREQARVIKQQLPQMRNFGERFEPQLAQQYNQLAWLVSNTEGDYQEALEASRESLALMPNSAGYLDTLARCYFAVGDLESAISVQEQALRRDPHSGQLQRQLEFFQSQQAATDAAPAQKDAP